MLVQKALRELDGEIDRLSRIRAIVASLHSAHLPLEAYSSQSARAAQAPGMHDEADVSAPNQAGSAQANGTETVLPKRTYRKLRFERSPRTYRPAPPMARALGGAIPAKPVFIASAPVTRSASVAPEVSAPPQSRVSPVAEPPVEGLDALLRELSYRPNAQRA